MKIAFSNDHAGKNMREMVLRVLREDGHEVLDFGFTGKGLCDYPDYTRAAVEAVHQGKADRAVLVCGTGLGTSIVANKFPGIRCAVCTDLYAAEMSRRHNNANALALRGREIAPERNEDILRCWLKTRFEAGRHQQRLDKIVKIECEVGGG